MNLDTSILRTFVTVAELKSFSKASTRLNRVQSAVSQQIQKLEMQIGHKLFDRTTSMVELTVKGELFLPYAIQILDINDKSIAMMAENLPKGRVKVGTSDTYASCFFSELLRRCAETYPEIEIEIQCGYSGDIWEKYEQGKLDLVLTQGCPTHINHEVIHIEPLQWVCSPTSYVYKKHPVPLALFSKGCGDREIALDALNRAGILFDVNFSSTSHTGIIAAVKSGCCVSVVLESTITDKFRVLGNSDGYPSLPNLELSIAYRNSDKNSPSYLFSKIIRDYFHHRHTEQSPLKTSQQNTEEVLEPLYK
ncbi:LysR substrate-binding domain-containing protein [Vibrio porteresiae]|uniref:LysR substrate-binding domain-containing protein n=1 Tax=Vibrio porteresiae DSM 19223 TaxID=1123496 RepID=A0ABZ0QAS5_9VIBR|nr:LysR substrate-binding domain-containing protein [Vibrio porteresiae]WPC72877.1 LysR substrate-binding domain-containing protein [Vibrio porteresiae DSM 19223]